MNLPTTEAPVLAACLGLLALRGIPHWRQNTGATTVGRRFIRFGVKGASDILAVLPPNGRMLAVECKRPKGGRLSEDQAAFLANVRDAGGIALVVNNVSVLIRALDEQAADPGIVLGMDGMPTGSPEGVL